VQTWLKVGGTTAAGIFTSAAVAPLHSGLLLRLGVGVAIVVVAVFPLLSTETARLSRALEDMRDPGQVVPYGRAMSVAGSFTGWVLFLGLVVLLSLVIHQHSVIAALTGCVGIFVIVACREAARNPPE
jgi:hypothetical protein